MVACDAGPIRRSNVSDCSSCFKFRNKFCPVIEYLKFLAWIQLKYAI